MFSAVWAFEMICWSFWVALNRESCLNASSAKTTSWMEGTESALSQVVKAQSTNLLVMGSDKDERRSLDWSL